MSCVMERGALDLPIKSVSELPEWGDGRDKEAIDFLQLNLRA